MNKHDNKLKATLQEKMNVIGQMVAYPGRAQDRHQGRNDPSCSDLSHASVGRDDAAEGIASIHAASLLPIMQQSDLHSCCLLQKLCVNKVCVACVCKLMLLGA